MNISGRTRLAAVLGWPVEHSRSPQLMNAAFAETGIEAVLVPIGVPPEGLASVVAGLRAQRALGASVTIPHKLAVAELCDQLTDAAREIGAVNCLQFDGGRLIGHNTDAGGYLDGAVAAGFTPRGAQVVVLGNGGAARGVAYGLRNEGATIEVIARNPASVTWTKALPWTVENLREAFARADLVIDCTPMGLGESGEERAWVETLPLDALRTSAWVSTLVYHRATELLERARSRGHATLDGRAMLVHQAARAFSIWTGRSAPVSVMTNALDQSLAGT